MDLPEELRAGPSWKLTATISLAGNSRVHSMPAGSLPGIDARFKSKDTMPPKLILPEERVNEIGVSARTGGTNQAYANRKKAVPAELA